MSVRSAGILAYRATGGHLEVLLAHPGGPYWASKDAGAWTVPKGEHAEDEPAEEAARREFEEETGERVEGALLDLGTVRMRSGKLVRAYAVEADVDPAAMHSNEFEIEWPPRSGLRRTFPEIDRVAWFDPSTAREKLNPALAAFVDRLEDTLASRDA